ncbi:hypothetical protein F4778DRAFT_597351 [Xylariomycetidae sp. FL2044]|nr:hypothetical protein F4778DRAFT_597351 [Xylariomycetidae sp. FL2044]
MSRFQIGWYRFVPILGYHHILMIINCIAIVLWSFLLASCSSSNELRNVYLLSLSYQTPDVTNSSDPLLVNPTVAQNLSRQFTAEPAFQEIRIGYTALCMSMSMSMVEGSGSWFCGSDANALTAYFNKDPNGDPLNVLRLAQIVRSRIMFYPLMYIKNRIN